MHLGADRPFLLSGCQAPPLLFWAPHLGTPQQIVREGGCGLECTEGGVRAEPWYPQAPP